MSLQLKSMTLSVAAALALLGCGKEEPKPQAQAPAQAPAAAPAPAPKPELVVKLGHAAPLTGPQAHLGKDNENGARLAVEEINAKGVEVGGSKIKVELMSEDDQADPKQGTLVAQKFVDAKVHGVIGHLNSGTTIPASKIYADANIPQVSGSATNPKYTQQGFKTAFRVMANDVQQGKVLGEFATGKLAAKNIAIIDDKTAYGEGLANEFEKAVKAAGGSVVAREFTTDKATDFAAILTKVKGKKPDLVFYGGMDAQGGPMAKQMKTLGVKAKFLTGDGGCTPEFVKLAGDAAGENNYCSLPGVPLEKMPGGAAFRDKYKAKFNADIQLYAPYLYDAVNVMVDAMRRAGSVEADKVLAELPKTDYEGVTAKIQFDEKGDLRDGAISVYQVKDGKWNYLETLGATGGGEAKPAGDTAAKVSDAAKSVGEAAKAVGVAAKEATREAVQAGAEAVKSAAEATKQAVEKK